MTKTSPEAEEGIRRAVPYWFEHGHDMNEANVARWFQGGEQVDDECQQFCAALDAVRAGAFRSWFEGEDTTAERALAYILVADQFSRNIKRGTADAFATDAHALEAARAAVDRGLDKELSAAQRMFMYLPFVHSESRTDSYVGKTLMSAVMPADHPGFAMNVEHFDVIQRFGRYPYRNEQVGRESTEEEIEWLKEGHNTYGQGKKEA